MQPSPKPQTNFGRGGLEVIREYLANGGTGKSPKKKGRGKVKKKTPTTPLL